MHGRPPGCNQQVCMHARASTRWKPAGVCACLAGSHNGPSLYGSFLGDHKTLLRMDGCAWTLPSKPQLSPAKMLFCIVREGGAGVVQRTPHTMPSPMLH
eukprot:365166-Chlamydomonas_euryale.AAC.1